jgi:hypothetical protein
MKTIEWKKPTISIFRERLDKHENEPFTVIKAQKISIEEEEGGGFKGNLKDFFSLIGDLNYISSEEGMNSQYVLCWFDDSIDDFSESFRKLTGVTFLSAPSYTENKGKKIYRLSFKAKYGLISQ